MVRGLQIGCLILLTTWATGTFAQGGPPLQTDDPGTPGNGNWELNLAGQIVKSENLQTSALPLLDANYGYGDHLQLNLVLSCIAISEVGGENLSGLSLVSTAVKWRFVDEEQAGFSLSTYPRVDSHWLGSSNNSHINNLGTRYFLPFEVAKTFGRLAVNPEVGYAGYTEFLGEWIFGMALGFQYNKAIELLAEFYARAPIDDARTERLFNIGTRILLNEHLLFIGSAGRSFTTTTDQESFWNLYLGTQIRL